MNSANRSLVCLLLISALGVSGALANGVPLGLGIKLHSEFAVDSPLECEYNIIRECTGDIEMDLEDHRVRLHNNDGSGCAGESSGVEMLTRYRGTRTAFRFDFSVRLRASTHYNGQNQITFGLGTPDQQSYAIFRNFFDRIEARTRDGVSSTEFDVGDIDYTEDHWYRIILTDEFAEFHIDNEWVATIDTTLPPPEAVLTGFVTTKHCCDEYLSLDWLYMRMMHMAPWLRP